MWFLPTLRAEAPATRFTRSAARATLAAMAAELRWYPSKVDWWVAVLLAVAPLSCLVALVATLVGGEGVLAAAGGAAFLVLVYGGLVLPVRYAVAEDAVVVRHGVVRQRIPLAEIRSVTPSRSVLSSPALSRDRLDIEFGDGLFRHALISPVDRGAFLAELAARAGLVADGDRLVRLPA